MHENDPQPQPLSFYDHVDEVLGPPPARLYRYGSSVLLGVLLLLAGVAFFLKVRVGVEGRAIIQPAGSQEIASPDRPAVLVRVYGMDGDIVRPGSTLAILQEGQQTDTLRASLGGKLKWQRRLETGARLDHARPLFFITGSPARSTIRIALAPFNYPAPTRAPTTLIRKEATLQPQGVD